MGGHLLDRITNIDGWLEHLHVLPGNPGSDETTNQFIRLAAEHRTANDFN
jgi:hypothetical protein